MRLYKLKFSNNRSDYKQIFYIEIKYLSLVVYTVVILGKIIMNCG